MATPIDLLCKGFADEFRRQVEVDIGVADEALQAEIADRGEDDARGGRRTGQLTASALILEGRAVQQLVSHHLQPHI